MSAMKGGHYPVRRFAGRLGIECGYSAHSMRATFITTAPENGASLEDVPPGIWYMAT